MLEAVGESDGVYGLCRGILRVRALAKKRGGGILRPLRSNRFIDMAKQNSAFMKPMNISADLAVVVGKGPMPRSEVTKNLWAYIKKNGLQDAKNKRNINADAALQKVFAGKKTVSMFEMTKLVSAHLS